MRILRLVPVAALLAALAACGGAQQDAQVGQQPSASGTSLALRVSYAGGFVAPGWRVGQLPAASLYADGRLVTPGPQIEVYPPPALPSVQEQRVSPGEVRRLVDAAVAAGVDGADRDWGRPTVADAADTVVTVVRDGRRLTAQVYALAEAPGDEPGLTAAQRDARGRLRAVVQALTGRGEPTSAYAYEAMAVVPLQAGTAPAGEPAPQTRAWPGPTLAPPCVLVAGDDLARVRAAAQSANQETRWTSAGTPWTVLFRPLLPDEHSCSDVVRVAG